jgi:sec-independent protein translocase protein TatA
MAWWHYVLLAVLAMLLLGGGKLSSIMGDAAKGVKAFRDGLKSEGDDGKLDTKGQPLPAPTPEKDTVVR